MKMQLAPEYRLLLAHERWAERAGEAAEARLLRGPARAGRGPAGERLAGLRRRPAEPPLKPAGPR
jgi:hypothetical protein